jgi:hypothetical protein
MQTNRMQETGNNARNRKYGVASLVTRSSLRMGGDEGDLGA